MWHVAGILEADGGRFWALLHFHWDLSVQYLRQFASFLNLSRCRGCYIHYFPP